MNISKLDAGATGTSLSRPMMAAWGVLTSALFRMALYSSHSEIQKEFLKVSNGGYFIESTCGADLSTDTIETRWQVFSNQIQHNSA